MQKKIFYLIFFIIIILVLIIVGSVINNDSKNSNKEEKMTDALKFKEEYESLNNKLSSNKKHNYITVSIDKENPMKYASYEEIVSILEEKTGIIYFGFPECPWCRNAVPILIDAAQELGIEDIYYYNALKIRDEKTIDDDGNIITEKEGTAEYKKLIELMYEVLPVYEGLNDDSIKRLYFPTVVFVKDGNIVDIHVSTLDSQEDPYIELNNEQKNELKSIYSKGINEVYDILCDEAC